MGIVKDFADIIYDISKAGYRYARGKVVEPTLEVRNTRANQMWNDNRDINTVVYQVLVENIGQETAHNCIPKIYFYGTRRNAEGEVDSEITVDTNVCWSRAGNPSSISLHGGESEWVDVFRLIEDYTQGENFDIHKDRHVQFPTAKGWEENAPIQLQRIDIETSNTSREWTRRAVWQTYWEEATLAVRCEEASLQQKLDFEDMNAKMDNSPLFSEDSFSDSLE
ncbi:hypothetical protein [Halostagnicola bangensis]